MDYQVISWDRSITNGNHSCNGLSGFKHEVRDITSRSNCWVDEPIDYILHFASPVCPRDFLAHPYDTLAVNSRGTENLLELAERNKAVFLYASSARVYLGEDPTFPMGVYEQAKRFGEAMTAVHKSKVSTRIVRMYNCYGPGARLDDGHVIPVFIMKALRNETLSVTNSTQWKNFIYIDDAVEGIDKVLFSDETEPVELGGQGDVRVDQLAKSIVRLSNSQSNIEVMYNQPSAERPPNLIKSSHLGWYPKTKLSEGLLKTIEDFRSRI